MKSSVLLVAITLLIILTTVTQVKSWCRSLRRGKRINRCSKINPRKWERRKPTYVIKGNRDTLVMPLESGL